MAEAGDDVYVCRTMRRHRSGSAALSSLAASLMLLAAVSFQRV
jgi:hypothetical protein